MTTALRTITREDALRALEEVVAEAGEDYVYQPPNQGLTCVYVADGRPSCLVGRALFRLGVSIETLHWLDREFGGFYCRDLNDELPEKIPMDESAAIAFARAQERQDARCSWGEALRAAKGGKS